MVFLEEPLRLNPSGARLPSWEGCSRIQPRGQGVLLLLYLIIQPCGWTQKFCRHKVGCHFPYDFSDYNNSLDLMQAPEPIFLKIR